MKLFRNNKKINNQLTADINKSKQLIKKEKEIIKEEKKKLRSLKFKKIKKSKLYQKLFTNTVPSNIKSQVLTMLYYELLGAILCLLVLYILSGRRNYFKIYHELNKFIDTYDTLTSNYYGKINKEELIDSAIYSMTATIDDSFTSYIDKDKTGDFEENVDGVYEGIGATVSTDNEGNIFIVQVFKDSPAEKAGLKENDIIKKIDDNDFSRKNSNDMAEYVKSSKKSQIKIHVVRDNKEIELIIKRTKINIPTVTSKIIEKDNTIVGYINLSMFTGKTASQFEKQLKELEKKKIKALIIDVRSNNGGYLKTATDISSLFLKKGEIIYQLKDKKGIIKEKDITKEHREYPIAILTNKYSASASEILAAAIKESYHGHVVGTKTYGKGTVQKVKELNDGTKIKFTVQKWLTPKGEWINEKGLNPTELVELKDIKNDNQIESATDILIRDLKE